MLTAQRSEPLFSLFDVGQAPENSVFVNDVAHSLDRWRNTGQFKKVQGLEDTSSAHFINMLIYSHPFRGRSENSRGPA